MMQARAERIIVSILLVTFLSPIGLSAFVLSPMDVDFTTTGSTKTRFYTISNDTDNPIAVSISVRKRDFSSEGEESISDGSRYFSIYPQKVILNPDTSQLIRVDYRGPSAITKELAFHIIFEQVPYNLGVKKQENGYAISYLFVFTTSSFVAPNKVIERMEANSYREGDTLVIELVNKGNVHQEMNNLQISIEDENSNVYKLNDSELSALDNQLVMASSKRIMKIGLPESLSDSGDYKVQFEYDYEYELL